MPSHAAFHTSPDGNCLIHSVNLAQYVTYLAAGAAKSRSKYGEPQTAGAPGRPPPKIPREIR